MSDPSAQDTLHCSCGSAEAVVALLDGPACMDCVWVVWHTGRRPFVGTTRGESPFEGLRVPMALKGEMVENGFVPQTVAQALDTEEGREFAVALVSVLLNAPSPEVAYPIPEPSKKGSPP